jgi:hypothetical protein
VKHASCQIPDNSRPATIEPRAFGRFERHAAHRIEVAHPRSITRIDADVRFNKSQILKSFRKLVKASRVVVAVYILDVNRIASAFVCSKSAVSIQVD